MERLVGRSLVTSDDFKKAVANYIETQRRSQILSQESQMQDMTIDIPYNYLLLVKLALSNEVIRTVHEAIIKEVVRNRWEVKPKWLRKCPQCGQTFQTDKEQCPLCKRDTVEPDLFQKQVLEAFIEDPNPDDEMKDIIESYLRYALSVDDWYISIQYADAITPLTIYVEDSVYMRVKADEYGRIGNHEYFCPKCVREHPEQVLRKVNEKVERCKLHPDIEPKETAYVYLKDNTVAGRFAKEEILHGKIDPWLPGLYGNSKLISCLRIALSITAMDTFNFDNYSTGKLAQILVFKGLSPEEGGDLAQAVKKQKDEAELDPRLQQLTQKLRTLYLGSKEGVDAIDTMPDAEKMQSIDWWKLWREIVCSIYGVTPIFVGIVESGKTGANPRMQIDVNNNVTEFYQRSFEESFNNVIVPKLGVTDWGLEFNPVEEKDEMQDIAVLAAKVDLVIKAVNAGMDAELTDEGEVHVSGKPERKIPFIPEPSEEEHKPFGPPEPFKQEKIMSQEKGKTWLVKEIDKDE